MGSAGTCSEIFIKVDVELNEEKWRKCEDLEGQQCLDLPNSKEYFSNKKKPYFPSLISLKLFKCWQTVYWKILAPLWDLSGR